MGDSGDGVIRGSGRCHFCHGAMASVYSIHDRWHGYSGEFLVALCGSCRSSSIQTVPGDVADYYPPEYYSYIRSGEVPSPARTRAQIWLFSHPSFRRWGYRLVARRVNYDALMYGVDSGRDSSVLDIGCGSGEVLDKYRAYGWNTVGVDIDSAAVEAASSRGHMASLSTAEELSSIDGSFDVVRLSHVIEHVPGPLAALRQATERVRPGGHLLVELPNISGVISRAFGQFYWQLDAPRHLYIPSPAVMVAMLERCGFFVRHASTWTRGNAVSRCIASYRYERVGGDPIPVTQDKGWFRAVEFLMAPIAWILDLAGAGDNLRLLAQREADF